MPLKHFKCSWSHSALCLRKNESDSELERPLYHEQAIFVKITSDPRELISPHVLSHMGWQLEKLNFALSNRLRQTVQKTLEVCVVFHRHKTVCVWMQQTL